MLGTTAYFIITFSFLISYGCVLASLALPRWLLFESQRPYRAVTKYGLFEKCSSLSAEGCRPFPSIEYGDCEEEGFCEEWNAAKIYMILASIVGGVVFLYLMYVIFMGGRTHREDAWKFLTFGIGMLSFLQLATIALIIHLYTASDKFYYGVKFDASFITSSLSALFNFTLACIIFVLGFNSPSEYESVD